MNKIESILVATSVHAGNAVARAALRRALNAMTSVIGGWCLKRNTPSALGTSSALQ